MDLRETFFINKTVSKLVFYVPAVLKNPKRIVIKLKIKVLHLFFLVP